MFGFVFWFFSVQYNLFALGFLAGCFWRNFTVLMNFEIVEAALHFFINMFTVMEVLFLQWELMLGGILIVHSVQFCKDLSIDQECLTKMLWWLVLCLKKAHPGLKINGCLSWHSVHVFLRVYDNWDACLIVCPYISTGYFAGEKQISNHVCYMHR